MLVFLLFTTIFYTLNNKENAKVVKKYYEIDYFTHYTTELLNNIEKNLNQINV